MQTEAQFKSEVVKYACGVWTDLVQTGESGTRATCLLKKALNDVNPIGPETLREVAMNAAEGIYSAELDALVTAIQETEK